jgi:tRNA nucleotidyltransferase (CCA-adding enzyme)
VIDRLNQKGYEAYLVGGCVRDTLLGKPITDWDMCTSALPEEILACFGDFRTIPTGIAHGTVTVILEKTPFEITTYRVDGDYLDCRHPDGVSFTASLEEDLARRDFTVNAMAYHPKKGLVDLYNGNAHLQERRICCVGEPVKRFGEDALRILRGLRFAATLGFTIEEKTKEAIFSQKELLEQIAVERVYQEMTKLICGRSVGKILSEYAVIFEQVLPDWQFNQEVCDALSHLPCDATLRYAALYKGNPNALSAMKRLRSPNHVSLQVAVRSRFSEIDTPQSLYQTRTLVHEFGLDAMQDIFTLKKAFGERVEQAERFLEEIGAKDLCCQVNQLAVSGKDLLELGIQGKAVGETLNTLLFAVMKDKVPNEKSALLAFIKIME